MPGHQDWAAAIAARYGQYPGQPPRLETDLVQPAATLVQPVRIVAADNHHSAVTHRHEVMLAPRLDLTVAVRRHEESQLVRRLVVQGERREAGRSAQPVAMPRPDTSAPVVAIPTGQRFEPVLRQVRQAVPADVPPQGEPRPAANEPLPPANTEVVPPAPAIDVEGLTERVVREIDRRGTAWRERQGRM